MSKATFTQDGNVAVMTWDSGENRFNPEFLEDCLACLDSIEKDTDATVLVVRSAHEKIWSNGLDLDWLMPVVMAQDAVTSKAFFYRLNDLFKRVLLFPMPTVAAMNGHAFAGGAILSCAFDFRYMRSDRGFFCFPEVDLGIPFLPGMLALLRKAMPGKTLVDLTLTGRRLTAAQAIEMGVVVDSAPGNEVVDKAIAWGKTMNKRRNVVLAIKRELYKNEERIFDVEDPPIIESGRLQV